MPNKLHTHRKDSQNISLIPSGSLAKGRFELRPSAVQQKQQGNSEKSNLKTLLIRAERHGHHFQNSKRNNQNPYILQPKIETEQQPIQQNDERKVLVIGGPKDRNVTLDKMKDDKHPSYDEYIGKAPQYAYKETYEKDNLGSSSLQPPNSSSPPSYKRIPDKFGGHKVKKNGISQDEFGPTVKVHRSNGPKKSYQPDPEEGSYLGELGDAQILNIVAHGTKSGKIGGYTPEKLAALLVNMGLAEGQTGTITFTCL